VRAVIDTGVLVSALIRRQGTTGEVLRTLRDGLFTAIYNTDILMEIIDVLGRPAFSRKYHIEHEDLLVLINLNRLRGDLIIPTRKVEVCRDPRDDKFLESALAGNADCIVSGDADLLALSSFENFPIWRPSEFLARL
jgi:uncharacterized protein